MVRRIIRRRGAALIYFLVAFVGVVGLCSLGVDYGRVQLIQTELETAAAAAARAGAANLSGGITAAQNAAISTASANKADGQPVILDRDADIEFGAWDRQNSTSMTREASWE